jgi:16S rRNA G1207 methylase RsmC
MILQKYQVLSQEYQNQAKQFSQKHTEIAATEKNKRLQIIENFEKHYSDIQDQMSSDHTSMVNEEGELTISSENRNLEEKYQELLKEITEKSEAMH